MKKTLFKRVLCAAVAAALTLPLCSCGRKSPPPIASKENIFKNESIELPEGFSNINNLTASGDRIFFVGQKYKSEQVGEEYKWENSQSLEIMGMDGSSIKSVVISFQSSENQNESGASRWVNKACSDENGNIALLINENTWDPETYENDEKFFISRYDKDGNLLGEIDVSSIKPADMDENDYFYISDFITDNDGNIYLSSSNRVFVTDSSGKLLFSTDQSENKGNSGEYINSICRTADGRVVVIVNRYSNENDEYKNFMFAKVVDPASKGYGAEYQLNSRWWSFYNGGGDYDLYVSTDNAMLGVKLETGESEPFIDWLKSGYDTTAMQNSNVLPDGRIICSSYSYNTEGGGISYGDRSGMNLNILTRIDPSEIPDKELITIYAFYLDYRVKQRIVEFNKNSEKYQVEVTTYSDYDDGSGSYEAGLTKMNNDLIAGNIPDILLINEAMPFDSYINKGIIADLNKYIDKDPDINKEDYLENILNALSKKNKLYSICPSFSLQTLVGKTKFVGAEEGWTMQDFLALSDANPDKSMFKNETNKEGFLYMMLTYAMDSYVDPETGECHFNGDGFKGILEAANKYPLEINYDDLYSDDQYWMKRETACREDRALLSQEYFYDFGSFKRMEQGDFGEDVTFIGYPCDSKKGTVIYADCRLAMTQKAKNPDGAWEFVKYFLTDEYQDTVSGSFPLKLSAYESLMEKAKKKPTYTDENGVEQEYDNTYWIGQNEIKIDVNSDADNERIMNLIKSATNLYSYDEELMKIITEESAAYFNGQKSVDEVADIIQNRANIYISTNR